MSDKLYAVIDTNVIVSALISKNDEIIEEYREVLSREKFHLNPLDVEDVLSVIVQCGLQVERSPETEESFPDPSDIVFYEVKLSREDAYLVTGNVRHYPNKPFVVTPREIIDIVEGK